VTKVVKQAGALMNKVPWEVVPENIIVDSDYEYLFTEKAFVSEGARATNFGFNRVGTFNNVYKVFTTTHAEYDGKIVLVHRGSSFMEAAEAFFPYVLFYIDDLIPTPKTLQASRAVMSRFAIQKMVGAKVAIINIV
jgi:hypothetical protein